MEEMPMIMKVITTIRLSCLNTDNAETQMNNIARSRLRTSHRATDTADSPAGFSNASLALSTPSVWTRSDLADADAAVATSALVFRGLGAAADCRRYGVLNVTSVTKAK